MSHEIKSNANYPLYILSAKNEAVKNKFFIFMQINVAKNI